MHIANIQENEQWANEISILFGVIGVILIGKISKILHHRTAPVRGRSNELQILLALLVFLATIIIKHETDSESKEQSLCDCFPKRSRDGRKRFDMSSSNAGYPSHFTSGSRGVISEDYYASFASQRDTIVKLKNLPISTAGETLPFLQHY